MFYVILLHVCHGLRMRPHMVNYTISLVGSVLGATARLVMEDI